MEKRRRRSSGWKGSSPSCPSLVLAHNRDRRQADDARIVAAMSVPGVRRRLTYNLQDFARYKQIETIRPQ